MNRIKKALEKCRTYVAVQKFGCGMTGIGHGVEDNILQFLNEADEELARLEKHEPTLMSDCISAGLPLDVALKYDVQLCGLTNYVMDKTLADCVKQEPVAWPIDRNWFYSVLRYAEKNPDCFDDVAPDCISLESNEADTVIDALNAASVSAKREWVDLTDDELKAALEVHQVGLSVRIGRIAIAAFKEKQK